MGVWEAPPRPAARKVDDEDASGRLSSFGRALTAPNASAGGGIVLPITAGAAAVTSTGIAEGAPGGGTGIPVSCGCETVGTEDAEPVTAKGASATGTGDRMPGVAVWVRGAEAVPGSASAAWVSKWFGRVAGAAADPETLISSGAGSAMSGRESALGEGIAGAAYALVPAGRATDGVRIVMAGAAEGAIERAMGAAPPAAAGTIRDTAGLLRGGAPQSGETRRGAAGWPIRIGDWLADTRLEAGAGGCISPVARAKGGGVPPLADAGAATFVAAATAGAVP